MLTKYRIIALVKGIIITNLILRAFTRLLAQESLKDLKHVFFEDTIVIRYGNDCALDKHSQEINTRDCLRTWNDRSQQLGNHDY